MPTQAFVRQVRANRCNRAILERWETLALADDRTRQLTRRPIRY